MIDILYTRNIFFGKDIDFCIYKIINYLSKITILLYIFWKMTNINNSSNQTDQFWVTPERAKKLEQGAICLDTSDILYKLVYDPSVREAIRELDDFDSLQEKGTSKKKWEILLENIQGVLTEKIKDKEKIKNIIKILEGSNIKSNKNLYDAIQEYLTGNKTKNKQSNEQTSYEDFKNPEIRKFIREFWGTKENFTIENFINLLQIKLYGKYQKNMTEEEKKKIERELKGLYNFEDDELMKKRIKEILGFDDILSIQVDDNGDIVRIEDNKWRKPIENWETQTKILDKQWIPHYIIDMSLSSVKTESGKYFPLIVEKQNNERTYIVQTTIEIIWINGEKETREIIPKDSEYLWVKKDLKNIMNGQENYTLKQKKNGELYIQMEEETPKQEETSEKKSFLARLFSKK